MSLRVTRQYVEVLAPRIGLGRVTRQYVDVLASTPTGISITVTHALGLTSSIGCKSILRNRVTSVLGLVSKFNQVIPVTVESTLALTSGFIQVISIEVTTDLGLTDSLPDITQVNTTLALDQSIEWGFGKSVESTLALVQSIQPHIIANPTIVTALGLKQSVTYTVLGQRYDRQYCPFVGEGSGPTPPPAQLTAPLDGVTAPFQLVYPATGEVTDSVTLRAPEFGNKDRLAFNRVNRETRGGTLIVFADPIWPKIQTLVLTFTALRKPEVEALQEFLDDYVGQELGMIDWEKRFWRGIVVSPGVDVIEDSFNSYTVSSEFEGGLDPTWSPQVIPVLPGTPRRRISPSHGPTPNPLEVIPPMGVTEAYTAEADESVLAGQPLYVKSTSHVALADAIVNFGVVGFATTVAGSSVTYATEGKLTLTDWSAVAGDTALEPGDNYYLSTTTGQITNVAPVIGHVVRIGRATSTVTLDIEIEPSVKL